MEQTSTRIGSYAPDFELPGTDGEVHHLARYLEKNRAIGVIFMCNHCPFVRLYVERLKKIQADFHNEGFTLMGINPNDAIQSPEDSFENMKNFAATHELNFPYLRDPTQDVARGFGAQITPEVFLLDRESVLRYCGGIDDRPETPELAQVFHLRNAVAQLMKGETVTPTHTEAQGCSLKWR
ncbi:thioredoxin family protein [Argonema galeatum]|uniref:thioredoxin family protein n=1 Tax=Argonema galeatum TaxID=2942762 RepID=UPI0020129973|nr:thioredoxin family protein [Argonema galeatum]MCL1466651.1 thioredoxin family protein [Argonema galeatum A003/A1]